MNISIRGIDKKTIILIDELAKEQKISRNQFLKNIIFDYVYNQKFSNDSEKRISEVLNAVALDIKENKELMNCILNLLQED